jgi:hypothetical protein
MVVAFNEARLYTCSEKGNRYERYGEVEKSHATRSAVELAAAAQVGHDTGPQAVIFVRYSPRQLSSVLLLNAIADSVRTADYPTTIVPLHCSPRRDATTPQNVSNTRAKRYFDVPVPHKEMSELAVRFVGAFAPRRHNEA